MNVNSSQGGFATVSVVLNVQAQITVAPAAVSFLYSQGDAAPASQGVSVFSNPGGVPLSAAAVLNPGEHWLSVGLNAGATTPSSVTVSVTPAGLAAGTYSANVALSSSSAATVNVPVTLTVVNATPKLSVSPATQTLTLNQGGGAVSGQFMASNSGGGTLRFTAQVPPVQGNWLALSGPGSGAATASTPAAIGFSVNPAGLSPGQYTGQIVVTDTGSNNQATVTILLAVSQASQSLGISQTGLTFAAIAGAQNPPAQTLSISNQGAGALSWTAQTTAPWLSVSPASGTSTGGQAGTSITVSANPSGLAAGSYYGSVNIAAPSAVNGTQSVSVLLNVAPAGQSPASITFSTGGLLLTGASGSGTALQQQITLYNSSNSTVNYTSSAFTTDGIGWLSLSPASGALLSGSNIVTVAASPASLGPGVQTGSIRLAFDNGATGALDVTLLATGTAHARPEAACAPSLLIPVFRQPVDQSAIQAGVAQRVQLQIVDDCGNPLSAASGGAAQIAFSKGGLPIGLMDTGGGIWEATWTPAAAASAVTLQAAASGQTPTLSSLPAAISVTVQSAAANAAGLISGIVNAAGSAAAIPGVAAPGAYVAIYGSGLAGNGSPTAASIPLPATLNGTQLLLGGLPMPLLYASSSQVNALVPQSLNANTAYQLVVARGGTLSVPVPLTLAAVQPAIYSSNLSGSGQGIVEIAGTSLLAAPASANSRPAQRGTDYIVVFATGLGAVTGANGEAPPADGAAAPAGTIYQTTSAVSATIGGVGAPVVFAGLTPSLVGLYQVNVQVPAGAPAGSSVPLTIGIGSVQSNTVTIALQ